MKKIYGIFHTYHKSIYISVLCMIVAFMPHFRALLSSSMIILALLYLSEGNFKKKLNILKERKSILILVSIFILHIIGLIYTKNLNFALNDLKIKLPLLLFPIVIGTSENLRKKDIQLIIITFSLSLFIKTILGYIELQGIEKNEIAGVHELAGKFSHIRYALMINIAILSLLWVLLFSDINNNIILKILNIFLILWFSLFIIILQSVTGWIIFIIILIYTFLYLIYRSNSKTIRGVSMILIVLTLTIITFYLYKSYSKYTYIHPSNVNNPELYTKSGNKYKHDPSIKDRENGYYVYQYICEKEMREEWNKISKYDYDQTDNKGQELKYTLMRYLTSKGLRKDKEGIEQLNQRDIKNIENGITNIIFENTYNIYPKIYEILWQFEQYKTGKNPEGHSITQRIEFLKIAYHIIKENVLFGVGTGDLRSEYDKMYKKTDSQLSPDFRLRAHNQFITFTVMFGILGFLWFLFAYISPGCFEKKYKDYLFTGIFIILSVSMLNEDTLETQMGVGIFAFFFSLFLYTGINPRKDS